MNSAPLNHDSPFRDSPDLLRQEAERLCDIRRLELESVPQDVDSAYVRRCGRIAFGVSGTLAAAIIAILTIVTDGLGLFLLVMAWPIALCAALVNRQVASRYLKQQLMQELVLTKESRSDCARLRLRGPKRREHELSSKFVKEGIAWPLTAIALLGPLTLHIPAFAVVHMGVSHFEEWMQASGILVGLSHLVLVRFAWTFPDSQNGFGAMLFVAAGTSMLPLSMLLGKAGLVFSCFVVTSLIVLVTGGVLNWVAFRPAGRLLARERKLLELGGLQ